MKQKLPSKTFTGVSALLLLLSASLAIAASGNGEETNTSGSAIVPIQQKPGDLLGGFKRGVCYSGFRHGQHPDRGDGAVNPSDKEILEDLQTLSRQGNFGLIRLYDAQADSEAVLRLIKTNQLNLKVMLGAWLAAEVSNPNCPWHKEPYPSEVLEANKLKNAREIDSAIRLANQYSNIVVAVAVGNEALVDWNDHLVPVDSVISYVRKVKRSIPQPVTVADNYNWWAHNGAGLARELDFVSVHTYPAWEGKDIDEAMPFSIANLQAVRNALPQSRIVITEAGWATVASEFGPRAGEAKQKRYYHDLFAWADQMNITTFFFEAFDEDWKGDLNNPLGAEKHWGLFTVDREPKQVMRR
ncbi:MAG: glycosyl hydrolase family 17 protein [Limisphaerales bacterium]